MKSQENDSYIQYISILNLFLQSLIVSYKNIFLTKNSVLWILLDKKDVFWLLQSVKKYLI